MVRRIRWRRRRRRRRPELLVESGEDGGAASLSNPIARRSTGPRQLGWESRSRADQRCAPSNFGGWLVSRTSQASSPPSRASSPLFSPSSAASQAWARLELPRASTSRASSRLGSARFHPYIQGSSPTGDIAGVNALPLHHMADWRPFSWRSDFPRTKKSKGRATTSTTKPDQAVRPRRRCSFSGGATRRRFSFAVQSDEDLIAFFIFLLGSFL
jgi:hypothetical protein